MPGIPGPGGVGAPGTGALWTGAPGVAPAVGIPGLAAGIPGLAPGVLSCLPVGLARTGPEGPAPSSTLFLRLFSSIVYLRLNWFSGSFRILFSSTGLLGVIGLAMQA